MRKRMAFHVVAIVLALLVGTLALPATSSPKTSEESTVARQTQGPITVQRLLNGRIGWALRLARALRTLGPIDPNPATQPGGFDIESITDEPDPVGISRDGKPDPLPGDAPEPVERDDHENDDNQDPMKAFGP